MNRGPRKLGKLGKNSQEDARFRAFYSAPAIAVLDAWKKLTLHVLVPRGGWFFHLLWALMFMKVYGTEPDMCPGYEPLTRLSRQGFCFFHGNTHKQRKDLRVDKDQRAPEIPDVRAMNGDNTTRVTAPITTVTMIAKYGKEKIELVDLPASSTTIGQVKDLLHARTGILAKRQKIIGLKSTSGASVTDETKLFDLKAKKSSRDERSAIALVHQFILMGTPEEQIFVDPDDKSELPDVVDDFDFDFNAGSEEWTEHKAKEENLQKFTEQTTVHIITPPRISMDNKCKPLLVLDLDHTLLDFSAKTLRDNGHSASDIGSPNDSAANQLKRPYMNEFLMWAYKYYDLVVWSQTSWTWLEIKLTELGMISHPGYNICFVLDKTSMFKIVTSTRSGKKVEHSVKPLQIIWSKFPFWGSHNTG
eukprot:CCRYP_019193-RC/>CCRYP_019193-RC protein AED:0.03 eAED:0.03 QI:137/1/1/1/1/1/2/354/416